MKPIKKELEKRLLAIRQERDRVMKDFDRREKALRQVIIEEELLQQDNKGEKR